MNRTIIPFAALYAAASWLFAPTPVVAQPADELRAHFFQPQAEAKPWTFWYWMYGAVTAEGITADLEAMADAGLAGAYLMPIKGVESAPDYAGRAQQLSPEWWRMVHHSLREADRLGLRLGMHICDGFALAGGPWIEPAESMQKVVWSDTVVDGGWQKSLALPQPEQYDGYYEDIAVYAIPYESQPDDPTIQPTVTWQSIDETQVKNPQKAINRDDKGTFRSSYPCRIDYAYPTPITARSVEIVVGGNQYQAHRLKVLAGDDGKTFRFVCQLEPARHGWQNYDFQTTHAIPPTTARYFRFEWTPVGSLPGSEDLDAAKWKPDLKIKEIRLHTAPHIHQWEGKAGLVWRVATATTTLPAGDYVPRRAIRSYRLSDGRLTARLPHGRWRLLRMGHTATGHTNATGGGAKGLECDKFSDTAVRKQLDRWFGEVYRQTDETLARRVLQFMHIDSWECGSQNWSDNFAVEFRRRRGYDLMPYLPLLAGIPIESAGRSEAVLRDVRLTIGDLVTDVFFAAAADCAALHACQLSAECVAPTMVSDGMRHYAAVDLPMGEFWLNSPTHDKPNDMLDAVSGAHVYGKNIIQAEGFTELRGVWDEDPAQLKPLLDRNYALGINRLFFHVFTHNPWLNRRPGMTLDGIGLFFQRDQTWWSEGRAFVTYAARCQTLLQYGHPVVDVAVYTGEEMPRRAVRPEDLTFALPGLYGADRVASERIRLANEGQPVRTRPVGVSASALMADPEDWVNPLRGYAYDSFNKDALLRLAAVRGGRLVLPGGASYKVLVLPTSLPLDPASVPLSPEAARKVKALQRAGVVVPSLPYEAETFEAYGLPRDVEVPAGVAWTHRQGEAFDLYFVANQQDTARTIVASFRDGYGCDPELWDATTGRICRPALWSRQDDRTAVTLHLAAHASVFVVFPHRAVTDLPVEAVQSQPHDLSLQPWTVSFPLIDRTYEQTDLFDWSQEADEKVKYYSGTAVYTTSFPWHDPIAGRIVLRLGQLYNVASVRLNGRDCGVVWTAPYEADITEALVPGCNRLEIRVTNTWANALRGAAAGKAPFDGIWTNAKYRLPGSALLPAGWLGPLQCLEIR